MTDEKKIRLKPNIIDFTIILLIIGVLVGVAVRYDLASKISADSRQVEAEVTFLIEGIRDTSVAALVEGDEFYWVQNDMYIGRLKEAVQSAPARVYVVRDDMVISSTVNPERYDATGTLVVSGLMEDGGFMLNGTQYIGPGKQMNVKSRNIKVNITIMSISIPSDDGAAEN